MNAAKDKFAIIDSVVAEYGKVSETELIDARERSQIMLATFDALLQERKNMSFTDRVNADYAGKDDVPPELQVITPPVEVQFDLDTEIERLSDVLSPEPTPKAPTLKEAREFIRRDMDRARETLKSMTQRRAPTAARVAEANNVEPEVVSDSDKKRIVVPKGLE